MKAATSILTGPIGLDIGPNTVAAAQLRGGERGPTLHAAAAFDRRNPGAAPDEAEALRIAQVLARRGFLGRRAVLCVPDEHLLATTVDIPAKAASGSREAMEIIARTELCRTLHKQAASIESACWKLPDQARAKGTAPVLAMACPHKQVEGPLDTLASAGLDVISLVPRACALAHVCAPLLDDAQGVCAVVDCGWETVVTTVIYRGVIVYHRSEHQTGLNRLRARLRDSMGIDDHTAALLAAACAPEEDGDDPLAARARAEARAHFEYFSSELRAALTYACHNYPEANPDTVLLTGPGAVAAATHAQPPDPDTSMRPVRPTDLVKTPHGAGEDADNPALITALGLADQERRLAWAA